MTVLASFDVIGIPRAQGSKRAFVIGGKARMTESAGAAGAHWRDAVAVAAKKCADDIRRDYSPGAAALSYFAPPFDGPLGLDVTFRFPMPSSRTKTQRANGTLAKISAPDTSKLVRSLEDGLQAAGLIVDDARFCELHARKIEIADGWTGAVVVITREATS